MITKLLLATSLALPIATDPNKDLPGQTMREKMTVTEPLVRSATSCIVGAVKNDPRYGRKEVALGDLIVASMPSCVVPVRAMIDAYDRLYGDGTGEAFFMGPYLDVLPKAVVESKESKSP